MTASVTPSTTVPGVDAPDTLSALVDLQRHPLHNAVYRRDCRQTLDDDGVLVLKGLLRESTLAAVANDGRARQDQAFYTAGTHTVYLTPEDPAYPAAYARNRAVVSSKGCLTTDQIAPASPLHTLYGSITLQAFLCSVLGESALHPYADPLSSINLHYAGDGQELGWHYDNSSFAITLLIEKPRDGGVFEYVKGARDSANGDMGYALTQRVLDGAAPVQRLVMEEGDLVLFRGRDALHRVTPTIGERTRMLVVLAYNTEPDISLSESARMTFYGRLG